MDNITINKGDLFIYTSKYGGVVKDTISDFNCVYLVDTANGVMKRKYHVQSSQGIWYPLAEVYICSRFLSEAECTNLENSMEAIRAHKEGFIRSKREQS